MKQVTLKRITSSLPEQTLGVLLDEEVPFVVTLEQQWANNQPDISCIPAGTYLCKRVMSPKFGDTFEVTNVTGRSNILFHSGNIDDNTKGCILVAEQFGFLNGEIAILSSEKGFSEFKERLRGINSFILKIQVC